MIVLDKIALAVSCCAFGAALAVGDAVTGYMANSLTSDDFLAIKSMRYDNGNIVFERAVSPPYELRGQEYSVVALWSAHVIPADGGMSLCNGSGSSKYETSEPTTQVWSLDQFVGDIGCAERLDHGERYILRVSWDPQDARKTVTTTAQFQF